MRHHEHGEFLHLDSFVAAMAAWKLGLRDEARESFDRGVAFQERNRIAHPGFELSRKEAEELLGLGS